ncbi:MAG: hypothetical protein GF411_04130 [Candidatus Lokiarchaeota archaeon]|nr:hypothetical protein [Candidatus Lokiarchaeota archaeon]
MRQTTPKLLAVLFATLMLVSLMPASIPDISTTGTNEEGLTNVPQDSMLQLEDPDFNLTNDYQKIWEPNNIRGSSHAVATTEDGEYMASAGGYLNDREVHIYRWHDGINQYYPIWDAGDSVIRGDVLDVAFMDADNDDRLEVVAGSADGTIYIFEQQGVQDDEFGLYSPAHRWDLVWDSGYMLDRQVWSIRTFDIDYDSHDEIIAGVWDGKVYVFDFIDAEAWPYCLDENWFIFELVWDSGDTISDRVNDIAIVDSDNDTQYEIVAGSQDHKVYIFEACACLRNQFTLMWDSGDTIYAPINSVAASQGLDGDNFGEIGVSAYGLGFYVFEYNGETEDFDVRKVNRDIMSWERGISQTTGVYTGYEADEWIDRKVYGWETQGIYENDPIPAPYDTEYLGGASALGGPWDDNETTFNSTEEFQFMREWKFPFGNETGELELPYDIASSPDGTYYLTDYSDDRVVQLGENMEFLTMWGEEGNETGQFDNPTGITVDEDGFVYVADFENSRIQKFNPDGSFILSIGSNGTALGQFHRVFDVATRDGKLYASDYLNHRIQVFNSTTGTFLFSWGNQGAGNGQFEYPAGIAIDSNDSVYIADVDNDRVQKFYEDGTFVITWGSSGVNSGEFDQPGFIVIDSDDRVYVSDTANDRVQKFSSTGDYESEFGESGPGTGQFSSLVGITLHNETGILALDYADQQIQRFAIQEYDVKQIISVSDKTDLVFDFTFDSEGNYYITSGLTSTILKYSSDGIYIKNWTIPSAGWAFGIEMHDNGTIFVSDANNHVIYSYDTNGTLLSTFGSYGTNPGQLDTPVALAISNDLLYVSEYNNDRISVFNLTSLDVEIIGISGSALGEINEPYGLTFDHEGILYVADRGNNRIQRFYKNGTAIDTWIDNDEPIFLEFNSDGYLYVTGGSYRTLKKYSPNGVLVDVFDGEFATYESRNGDASSWGIEFIPQNNSLMIVDSDHDSLIMIDPYLAMNNQSVAIVDFGQWEEITGDSTETSDFYIVAETSMEVENIEFAISQDLKTFVTIDPEDYVFYFETSVPTLGFIAMMGVNVDNVLNQAKWDDFRYLKIAVRGGDTYKIDAAFGRVNRPIATALTVSIGDVKTTEPSSGAEEFIIGTVDGEIMAYSSLGSKVWESQSDQPRFSLGTQIWDIVQVTGRGRIPTWLLDGELVQDSDLTGSIPGFERFTSYTMVNIDYNSALDIVATVKEGAYSRLIYLRNTGTDESPSFTFVPNYFITQSTLTDDQILGFSSIEMGDLDGDNDVDMLYGTVWYDVDTGWYYELDYFEQTSYNYWTERAGYIPTLSSAVSGNGYLPQVTMQDLDYDGDLDVTIALAELHMFEQIDYFSGSQFFFAEDSNYFNTINNDFRTNDMPGKVGFADFDMDSDIDIIVPHSTSNFTNDGINTNASRMTFYENTGNWKNVEWTKRRAIFEPDFTGTLIDPDHGYTGPLIQDLDGDSVPDLVVLQKDSIDRFFGRFDHNAFIAATYPYLHMVEVDKRSQSNGYWGYEAYDSWSNSFIFESWSRSLEFGDVDQDNLPEVFVGSFDNNIIAFENVANNTYRRSWRSQDIFLQSWTGEGTLPVYRNVRDMVIGDQDKDGKQEIIMTAGYNVYVFETIGTDMYELVWMSSPIAFIPPDALSAYEPPVPRAPDPIAIDQDLDNDGKPEIIVGAEFYLIIYEMVGDNNYTPVQHYELAPYESGNADIKSIITLDSDKDSFREIVVVGSDEVIDYGVVEPVTGWMRVFENARTDEGGHKNDSYVMYYFDNLNGPGYALDTADFDNNELPEIFVGTWDGIEIYESIADNALSLQRQLPTPEPTKAIRVGNTDTDSWMEIVAGSGKNLTVYEQNQTYDRSDHYYDEVWNSGPLHEEITDIRIGDSNQNNRLEIIAVALKGYLYSFEWRPNATESGGLAFSMAQENTVSYPEIGNPTKIMPIADSRNLIVTRFSDPQHIDSRFTQEDDIQ